MKTSNTILTLLIGSITFVIIAGAVQLRITGAKKPGYGEQVTATFELHKFRSLVVSESVNLVIMPSDKFQLEVINAVGEESPMVRYREQGDTLFIDEIRFAPRSRTLMVNLKTPLNDLQYIKAANTSFSISNFPTKSLRIELHQSSVMLHANDTIDMGTLRIDAVNHSSIDAHNINLDTLVLNMDQSEARVPGGIGKLKGSMANRSSMSINGAADVEFGKDFSSKWH